MREGRIPRVSGKFFKLRVPKTRRGDPSVSEMFLYWKKIWLLGVSRLCLKSLVWGYEKKIPGTLQFLRKFLCEKNFGKEEGYHDFLSENFCLTVSNNFVGEPFFVSEKLFEGIKLMMIGRASRFFDGLFFASQCRKIVWGTLQCMRKFGVSKRLYG